MKLLSFLLIAIAFQGIAIPDVFSAPATTSKRVVGYYTYWSPLAVKSINGNSLTHINYAFANIDTYTLKAVVGNPSTDTDKVFGVQDECSCCAKGTYIFFFFFSFFFSFFYYSKKNSLGVSFFFYLLFIHIPMLRLS